MSFKSSISLILCSFIIVGLAQPDWSLICCLLTSAVGYALFWKGNSYWRGLRQQFFGATLWFAAVQALHVNWLTATYYIGPLIWLGYLFILAVKGLQFGALSVMVANSKKVFAVAGLWVLMEWFCLLFIFSGYAFDPVGLALSASSFGLQCASLLGVLGLSFWVIATNLLVLRGKRGAAVCAILVPFIYGGLHFVWHKPGLEKAEVLLVQTALSPELRYPVNPQVRPLSPADQWRRVLDLLSEHQGEPIDLIVFPESAVYGPGNSPFFQRSFAEMILSFYLPDAKFPQTEEPFVSNSFFAQTIANTFGADLIIGLEWDRHNVACLFEPGGEEVELYSKQQLVPFGEYMPMRGLMKLPGLRQIVQNAYSVGSLDQIQMFERGREANLLGNHYGVSVCYEEVNGALMLKTRRKGAQMHVNISNDGWFPNTRLPVSHFFHGKLRTVEQGVPLLRACNTGVTCGVDSRGRVIDQLPHETKKREAEPGVLRLGIPTHTYKTLYGFTGNILIVLISFLVLPKKWLWSRVSRLWKKGSREP